MMDGLHLLTVLLLSTAVISTIRSQYISPDPSFIVTGGNTTLTCHHTLHPDATVSWIRGGLNALSNDVLNETRLEPFGSDLFISSFRASELSGKYTCIVDTAKEEDNNVIVSCPAEVKHAHIQAGFHTEPSNTTAFIGGNAVIRCRPRLSVPQAAITWTHKGQLLDSSPESRWSLSSSGNLYILNTTVSDRGEYRCTASNTVTGVSRKSREATLEVIESLADEMPYAYTVEPENTTVIEGSRLVIECAGQGYPQPYEAWEKHQSPVLPDGLQVMPTGELVFENVSRSHSGIYICRLRDQNHTEVAIKQIVLIVKVPPHFTSTPPSQVSIERGSNSTVISCSAAATDSLSLYLIHNGVVLHAETGSSPTVQTAVMLMDHVNSQIYQCIATNSIGCIKHDVIVMFINLATTTPEETTPTSEETTPTTTTTTTTTVFLTPEGSGGTMGPPPTLDIMTSGSIVANVGERQVQSECEVTVSNDEEINVTWLLNGELDLETDPINGVTVQKSEQENRRVVAFLTFDPVWLDHDGSYTCQGTTSRSLLTVMADITLTVQQMGEEVTPPTSSESLDRPSNIEVKRAPNNDLQVSWDLSRNNEAVATGFKINWDTLERIEQSARDSLPILGGEGRYTYTISNFRYNNLIPLKIYLWAYNIGGDGPFGSVEVLPLQGPTTSTSPNTPSVGSTTITTGNSTPGSSITSDRSTPLPVLECSAAAISPTSIRIEIPEALSDSSFDLMVQCEEAGSSITTTVDALSSSSSSLVVINQALPGCSYIIELRSSRRLVVCEVSTPSGQVDIQAVVNRYANGTVLLTWSLPPEIRESEHLSIEVDWGKGWIPVTAGLHAPAHFEPEKQYQVQLRFRHGNWEGILNVTIPPAESNTGSNSRLTELSLLYSMIFGGIVIGCGLLVVVILGLKYVQWSRRDIDKVTNYREKSREEFERMSINRSSMNSVKSSKI